MDPTGMLCMPGGVWDSSKLPGFYSIPTSSQFPPIQITKISKDGFLEPKYCDLGRYEGLMKMRSYFSNPKFNSARIEANAFENLGNSIFMDRAGVKLANVDVTFNISGHLPDQFSLKNTDILTYCDLAGGPGAFVQYLQWRYPNSIGYGITLRKEIDYRSDLLDRARFFPIYGDDKERSGDLYIVWKQFIDEVMKKEKFGVDFVVADGGINVVEGENWDRQELLNSRLIFIECYVATMCCKIGGNIMVKVYGNVSKFSADMIYLLSGCFDRVTIFKPISSRPANLEFYLVALKRRDGISPILDTMRSVVEQYDNNNYISNIFSSLPPVYEQWLKDLNHNYIEATMAASARIIKIMNSIPVEESKYIPYKAFLYWGLPSTPILEGKKKKILSRRIRK